MNDTNIFITSLNIAELLKPGGWGGEVLGWIFFYSHSYYSIGKPKTQDSSLHDLLCVPKGGFKQLVIK